MRIVILLLSFSIILRAQNMDEPGACYFKPPKDWQMIDQKALLPEVKVMVKGDPLLLNHIPPSINLAIESTTLSQKEYIDAVHHMNVEEQHIHWMEVGHIQTDAGKMTLTQLDVPSEWGPVRMFQAILVKRGVAYVITATASVDEFQDFSPKFLAAIRTFHINKDLFQMVPKKEERKELLALVKKIRATWEAKLKPEIDKEEFFASDEFQNEVWKPFCQTIFASYSSMGEKWQTKMIEKVKNDLLGGL